MQQAVSIYNVCVFVSFLNVFTRLYSSDLLSNITCSKIESRVCFLAWNFASGWNCIWFRHCRLSGGWIRDEFVLHSVTHWLITEFLARFTSVIDRGHSRASDLTPLRLDVYICWIFGYKIQSGANRSSIWFNLNLIGPHYRVYSGRKSGNVMQFTHTYFPLYIFR